MTEPTRRSDSPPDARSQYATTFFVTSGEPRKTHELRTFSEALHFAYRRELHGDAPVRVLEEIDWKRMLAPDERDRLERAAA